jgi:Nucleotide-sugar transporter
VSIILLQCSHSLIHYSPSTVSETISIWGIPLKYLSLVILVVQNSALILVMRYTRASVPEDQLYLASTAVVMSEVMKALVCMALLFFAPPPGKRTFKRLVRNLNRELIVQWRETLKLSIPAGLYLIQVKKKSTRINPIRLHRLF